MQSVGETALIVEGGAMRGVFSCGVLDYFLQQEFSPFESFWGVSAGSTNLSAYLAKMPGRNLKIYADYSCRKAFFTPHRFLMGGDLLDIDWLWDVTMSELAIDLETLAKDGRPFFIGVTNKNTGKAEYLLAEPETLAETMKASSALPVMYKGEVILGGESYVDGGASDSIPVAEAIKRGARKIMVLRSQTYSYRKSPPKSAAFVKYLLKSSPALIKPMLNRATQYNETIELMRTPPEGIEIIEICPPDSLNIKRLTRNPERLMQGYEIGLKAGEKAISLW